TIGEEWRKGWHPEIVTISRKLDPALIIGGGSAGLEAARVLAQRGGDIILAEGGDEWGGRVARESRLPGLATWNRVRDWRIGQLKTRPNAELYLHSRLSADDVLQYAIPNVAIATGAVWRCDGVGRTHRRPLGFLDEGHLVSPDAILAHGADAVPGNGPVVIF